MKTVRNILLLLFGLTVGLNVCNAQASKKDKKVEKETAVKNSVDSQHYTFSATYMLPQRGGGKPITDTYYDLKVTRDSVIAYLPYYGRAYFDVPYNGDGGIKFTSTKFEYQVKAKKKSGWEIQIKPTDVRNIEHLILNISPDGYASLSVTSTNRDYIAFDGYLK
jgi:hypothetical protein